MLVWHWYVDSIIKVHNLNNPEYSETHFRPIYFFTLKSLRKSVMIFADFTHFSQQKADKPPKFRLSWLSNMFLYTPSPKFLSTDFFLSGLLLVQKNASLWRLNWNNFVKMSAKFLMTKNYFCKKIFLYSWRTQRRLQNKTGFEIIWKLD